LTAAKTITKSLFGENDANEVLSDNTVKRRIDEMAQLVTERLRENEHFASQLDESHVLSNNANLAAFCS
jgi:hypothetical protein